MAPLIALFFVWLSNGIWHGVGWTYLFYGMYYFVLIFIENITEAPIEKFIERKNIHTEKIGWRLLTALKLFIIVNVGELFFRASSITQGFGMLGRIFTSFHISVLKEMDFGLDNYDIVLSLGGLFFVRVVYIFLEMGISIRAMVASLRRRLRWSFWYAVIFCIVIFGAYGAGYTVVDMIYAAY